MNILLTCFLYNSRLEFQTLSCASPTAMEQVPPLNMVALIFLHTHELTMQSEGKVL